MTEIPTPRTDVSEFYAWEDGSNSKRRVVASDFARKLECEIAELKDLTETQQMTINNFKTEVDRLRDIIRRARIRFHGDDDDVTAATLMLKVLDEADGSARFNLW